MQAIVHVVISRGVQKGIEKFSKVMMPMLLLIIGVLVVCAFSMPGIDDGLRFLLKPDFSKLTVSVVLSAMGQAFCPCPWQWDACVPMPVTSARGQSLFRRQ